MGPIVVIEDDDAIAEALTELLVGEGFIVDCASNGLDGLALIRSRQPHAVILDLTIPGMSGWEVLHEVRQGVPIPVIITSSEVVLKDATPCEIVLQKPYSIADLLKILNGLPFAGALPQSGVSEGARR